MGLKGYWIGFLSKKEEKKMRDEGILQMIVDRCARCAEEEEKEKEEEK